jgi:hypothetical protein
MIYKREKSSAVIKWQPRDTTLGEQAMEKVVGEIGVKIDNKTAAQVRDEYKQLHVEKYGQESPFYSEDQ